jgi:pectate lyase
MKCSLIGHTDNTGQQATDALIRVTYHHNWFSYTDGRNPSLRFGAIHMFNNYFEEITDYGLAARDGGHAKMENNHYNNVLLPMSTDKFPVSGLPNGYICETGNIFTGTCGANVISQTGCDFWTSSTLPYKYTLDAVSTVAATVKANTGVGKVTNLKSAEGITEKPNISLSVYPNPFAGSATIGFTLDKSSNVQIKLFDMVGKQVAVVADQTFVEGDNAIHYNNQGLKPGVYILTFKSGNIEGQTKIIVR